MRHFYPARPTLTPDLSPLRLLIQQAQEQDLASGQLHDFLEQRHPQLHAAIKLPAEQAAARLADFVLRYIRHVPDFLEAMTLLCKEAGIYSEVAPVLNIAKDYFLSPPSLVCEHSQMQALLDEAYLAHRLLEEVNDRFMAQSGVPLAPMDMTLANIIAHELIGEPFANELDQAVLFSAELLLNEHRLEGENLRRYAIVHQHRGWEYELKRWPCLVEDLAIGVDFNPRFQPPVTHH